MHNLFGTELGKSIRFMMLDTPLSSSRPVVWQHSEASVRLPTFAGTGLQGNSYAPGVLSSTGFGWESQVAIFTLMTKA